ncbi:MAG: transcription termination/antitermination NusG family protein, partial [Gemmataceae bacterium]
MTENVSSPDPTPAVTPPAPPEAVHEEHTPAPAPPPPEILPEAAAPAEPMPEAAAPDADQPEASSDEDEAPAASDGEEQTSAEVEAPPEPEAPPNNKHWYVVKVQSGREESIKDAIERRVKIEALEEYYGQIVIPVERVTEMRNGKRVQKERKLYPG